VSGVKKMLVHRQKIYLNVQRMFYLFKLVVYIFLLRHSPICSPAPSPNRHIGPWGSANRIGNGVVPPDAAWSPPASLLWLVAPPAAGDLISSSL